MPKSEKLQATDEQLTQIEARRNALDWSTGDDSDALIEAARVLIFGSSNGDLPARITEERITRKELCVRAKYNKWKINEQIEKSELERSDIDQLIGDRILVPQGISYRSWKDFRGQKDLDKRAFKAYWVALGLSLEELGLITPGKLRANRLYRAILTLDHTEQLHRLTTIGCYRPKVGTFLINTQCRCSRAWLMWRLETEILACDDDSADQIQRYSLNVLSTDNIQSIKDTIKQKVYQFSRGNYNLIIRLDNIDQLDRDQFENFSQSLEDWKSMIQESENYFILYLIDGNTNNNWREQYEQFKFPITQHLTLTELTMGLPSIHRAVKKTPEYQFDVLARQILDNTNEGQVSLILENIYHYLKDHFKQNFEFNLDLQGETRWFNYP
ncbi:hypothetical protein PMG71_13965 [Roseofilum sp. BLCC_M154]|uniref:Uncharacterized protein n=1 Tax=Roseofilum acuticapitatum BLCC-M154 TaxID=3022444 RepID=A0ABT7AUF0_9CYAN|nr:hypothetical protein [Roseofilum acuticapitatum]MDJ1170536.1 hypothetical protein [Roseofilum acuticapitatum BLCC-M154]